MPANGLFNEDKHIDGVGWGKYVGLIKIIDKLND